MKPKVRTVPPFASACADGCPIAADALPKKRVSSRKQALAPAPAPTVAKEEADGGSDVIAGKKKSPLPARGKSRRKGPEPEDAGEEGVGDAPPPPLSPSPPPPQRTRKKSAPAPVAENNVPVQGAKKRRRKETPTVAANDEAIEIEDPKVVGKAKRKRGGDGGDGDEGEDEDGGRKRVNGVSASARFKLEELRTNSAENALEEFKKNSDALAKGDRSCIPRGSPLTNPQKPRKSLPPSAQTSKSRQRSPVKANRSRRS